MMDDRKEIERLHAKWMKAQFGLIVGDMQDVFVGADKFHGFNLNLHTYNGIGEWTTLWNHYKNALDIAGVPERTQSRLEIRGDMAWLSFEGVIRLRGGVTAGQAIEQVTPVRFRGTEVYLREDDGGRPVWKMWHCHYSPCAPEGEAKPGFEQT